MHRSGSTRLRATTVAAALLAVLSLPRTTPAAGSAGAAPGVPPRGSVHMGMGVAAQADYFVDRGGAWSPDDRALPGVLDIEWNPCGDTCYGTSRSAMVSWIRDFPDRYRAHRPRRRDLHGDQPVAAVHREPRRVRHHPPAAGRPVRRDRGELPAGRASCTRWQYTSTGPVVGDHDLFNGTVDQVRAPALGRRHRPAPPAPVPCGGGRISLTGSRPPPVR
ncbi:GH25 family lysozyme [Streptomyces hirsutus]|uniref:GH25 family lysozyme n=1 Tax=Streptomyces hirsutus TaxID=35620 RepID=UPI0036A7E3B5